MSYHFPPPAQPHPWILSVFAHDAPTIPLVIDQNIAVARGIIADNSGGIRPAFLRSPVVPQR